MTALPTFDARPESQRRVLDALPHGGGCTTRTAAQLAGVPPTSAYRALVALEASGAVVRMGEGKLMIWFRGAP